MISVLFLSTLKSCVCIKGSNCIMFKYWGNYKPACDILVKVSPNDIPKYVFCSVLFCICEAKV